MTDEEFLRALGHSRLEFFGPHVTYALPTETTDADVIVEAFRRMLLRGEAALAPADAGRFFVHGVDIGQRVGRRVRAKVTLAGMGDPPFVRPEGWPW